MVDYDLLSSTNNLPLQGDTTYLVTGRVNVTGTVTIEGGTVVKYTNNGNPFISATNIICETGPYRPGVFTSMNDNSVGSEISGSTGAPSRGPANCLEFGSLGTNSFVFSHLRFSYANFGLQVAMTSISSNPIEVWDCQFINCWSAVYDFAAYSGSNPGFPVNVYNVLFSQCVNGLYGTDIESGYVSFSVNNVTADQVESFAGGITNLCYATNSIFTATGTSGIDLLTSCCTNASSNGIYQTVGAGSYYLADGSTNRGAGTTNIDPALLGDLQTKTTYPPVTNSSYYFTNDYTVFPQAQRDDNGSTVDLGYHYDPIDYALCILVFQCHNDRVSRHRAGHVGAMLWHLAVQWGQLAISGLANQPINIGRYNTVQEMSNTNWSTSSRPPDLYAAAWGSSATASFRFVNWSALASEDFIFTESRPQMNTLPL